MNVASVLSTGLPGPARAPRKPAVPISGFTHPLNEFSTPYRVINDHACNSCWNDVRRGFDHTDTPRQFESTRRITIHRVRATLQRIPGLGALPNARTGPCKAAGPMP